MTFASSLETLRSSGRELDVDPKIKVMALYEKLAVEANLDQLEATAKNELGKRIKSIVRKGGTYSSETFFGEAVAKKDVLMIQLEPVEEGGMVQQYTFEVEVIWENDQLVWLLALAREVPTYELLGDSQGNDNELVLGEKLAELYEYLVTEVKEEEEN